MSTHRSACADGLHTLRNQRVATSPRGAADQRWHVGCCVVDMHHRTLLTWDRPGLADLQGACGLVLLVAALFAVAEGARRRGGVEVETTRKCVHVGGGLLTLLVPWVLHSMWAALALALGGTALLCGSAQQRWLRSVHDVERASRGAVLFPVAMAACLVVSRGAPVRFEIPLLALTLADAAAALVGQRRGTHRLPMSASRTVEGSAAFVVVTGALSVIVLWAQVPVVVAIAGALWLGVVLALVEVCSPNGWDNITIVAVGAVAVEWVLRVPWPLVCAAGAWGALVVFVVVHCSQAAHAAERSP